ncbi:TonB-linked SusC/RagA family outer membrane protein [Parabacteroides sp. PF5-5]|uniref:SusC/RagA family TonB-linked outer membrane protein n=1 Tax=unclassified Parabacteroides TaxID=2649774 RepID=UPI0024736A7B|nr:MULTISPECIES: SusC/RagA family TonB-linked outer membrane protein [unclassified Parabacteroides]MDH6305430.1 TonB-linked SusC/RagA family outer membrane protein [Parabacteroides sp. PH5-39]MDH6316140.1 TonB-linked SusC/RagA family outer membrane protein [Parabacteroides sp. PF5-13]MDH6320290.1 TonB-linked SusC/RagA family outer membrane protein [Parabacteroides sp. PH5-13]MDH6324020.1 TonB-linked SusC/RagA family outer membrane protein [Parabacteroides sp. PH5-8]MDH6327331.1 TonB-linked Sus
MKKINRRKKNSSSCVIHCVLKSLALAIFLFSGITYVMAESSTELPNTQQTGKIVKGTVTDESGNPLIGVTVSIQGTFIGTITDVSGQYSINVPEGEKHLLFSYVGFMSQSVEIKGQSVLDIRLLEDSKQLEEVVVTALGIKREKKALGYAVQELQGGVLTEVRDPNMLNSLAGQVAGVQISNVSTGGIGGSPKVSIRGETSLTNNEPLFVIDGIPVSNMKSDADGVDFGNGAGDINPDDVESISVLKGPTASALYGSRAANGVIVITTKSGKESQGLGVTYNTSLIVQPWLLKTPDYQYRYGGGENFEYEYVDGAGGGKYDGSGYCWGPLLNQRDPSTASGYTEIAQYSSPIDPVTGKRIPTPWVANKNFLNDFFETGRIFTNNVSISGGNEKGNFRLSYTNLDQKGIVPNTDLARNTFALNAGYNLMKNLRVDANVNYVINKSDNMPQTYYWDKPIMYTFMWWGMNEDVNALKNYWKTGREGVEQNTFNMWLDNPYFTQYENTQGQLKNRIYGNITLSYQIIPGLTLVGRTGTDWYDDNITVKRAYSSQNYKNGMYSVRNRIYQERNTDFLLTWEQALTDKISYKVSAGGNRMSRKTRYTISTAPELSIPGLYNLGNSKSTPYVEETNTEKAVNSIYGMGQISYANMLFLDVTARNDWASTLPSNDNSFFYPSVSLSGIITEMVKLPEAISFFKVRGSWAQVGNDTDPYQLQQIYSYGTKWGTLFTAFEEGKLYNSSLKPEKINSYEVGLDFRMFNNRLGFDFAYYNTVATNQILSMEIAPTSGYSSRNINAGKIESRGFEVVMNATPIKLKDFTWNVALNWSTNRAYVRELAERITTYDMGWPAQARVGQRMGDLYGWGFKHAPDGQIIYQDGLPVWEDEIKHYGNYNPDWMAGMKNSFSYKGFTLSGLLDYRKGGRIYSGTLAKGMEGGVLAESAIGNQREEGVIGEGVMEVYDASGNVSYVPNDVKVSLRDWIGRYHSRDAFETNSYDASYIKLRELSLSYTIPRIKLSSSYALRNVMVSVVGRNLWMWAKARHIDPETGTNGAEDVQIPTPKSVGINLSVSF